VLAAQGEAAAGRGYRVDHRIVLPGTGEVRYLTTNGAPSFDAEGRLESILGASLDTTDRVRADEILLEREGRLQRALSDTVAALGATVAMRDPYTAVHERRVAALACALAERLGWGDEAVETMRTVALVHDVGKIAVPAEILAKPARLTEAEFDLVKAHPQAAYDILSPIDFGTPIAEIVLQHHERLDGSGYPRGLSRTQILPAAQVLAIADVVEAMVSHRPYRPALPLHEAMAELADGAGRRYDAAACALCHALFENGGFTLPD
jgi:HD-GYP domain-containing protein (c-di-GMP phosphodiesterase class II)